MMDELESEVAVSPRRATGFVPVAVETLLLTTELPFDLFVRTSGTALHVLYRHRHFAWQQQDVSNLLERGIRTLYIESAYEDAYCEYLQRMLKVDDRLSHTQHYNLLQASTHALLRDAYRRSAVISIVCALRPIAEQIAQFASHDEFVFRDICCMMANDDCSFTQASNAAVLCVAMATCLGVTDTADLTALACGPLLHDISTRQLDRALLKKRGRLNPRELTTMRRHPQLGFEQLCEIPLITWPELMMVYQHHERVDGSGYPTQVVRQDIHPWAQIYSVADAFTAMTSERPYRRPMTKSSALALCQRCAGRGFDPELVKCLTSLMSGN